MENRKRKTYYKPKLETVYIDRNIVLMQATNEDNPPNPPLSISSDDSGSSETESTSEPTKQNSFEENPFER